ncbi:hypothetical protein H632_c3941p0 [Helicosporidium sp. ATCC 50920]|nr:hypothetical protein H632_c3941p0 [Helicosporidium sp. ATCC 50920]|eukprot:KDD72053.1 hypothetical protein H632_c3941p0 [Helicosporidium sp. ATCC 50920]
MEDEVAGVGAERARVEVKEEEGAKEELLAREAAAEEDGEEELLAKEAAADGTATGEGHPASPSRRPTSPQPRSSASASPAAAAEESRLTGPFRAWCEGQLSLLGGRADISLCEFLLTVGSNSEVAEYITAYLGASPAVSRFSTEFMSRRLQFAAGKKVRAGAQAAGKTGKSPDAGDWAEGAKARKNKGAKGAGGGLVSGSQYAALGRLAS